MHLLYVEVDGFKSYAVRTLIGPFDAKFNAITGLNGSGKFLPPHNYILPKKKLTHIYTINLFYYMLKLQQHKVNPTFLMQYVSF
jgi:hypothetical protein